MKKILLSLFAVLMTVGAWAQVTAPATGVYVISGDNPAGKRGNLAAVKDVTTHPALSNITWDTYKTNSADPIENGEDWYVHQTSSGKYAIYNLGLDKYLVNPKDGNKINFGDEPYFWEILVNNTNSNFNSIYDAVGTYLCFACGKNAANRNVHFNNEPGDGGSLHTFTAVEDGETKYAAKIAEIQEKLAVEEITYTFTDASGKQYTGKYSGIRNASLPENPGCTFTDVTWSGATCTANVSFPFLVNENVVIRTYQDGYTKVKFYWTSPNGINIRACKEVYPTTANYESYLWQIIPQCAEGIFAFTIKNVSTGKFVYTESTANAHDENTVLLSDDATLFTTNSGVEFVKKGANLCLSIGTTSGNNGTVQNLGTWESHHGTKNTIYPPLFGVVVGDTGFATLYSPFAVTLPENVKAYAVSSATSSKAMMDEKADIPANQGAIIEAAAGTYTFTAGEATSDWTANLLKGSATDTEVAGEGYVLASKYGVTGFYKAKLTDGKFKNNAGKAYLPASAVPASARFISFDFGTETAIESVESVENNAVVYDLAGRRVQGAQKGIFIVNGKKVIK